MNPTPDSPENKNKPAPSSGNASTGQSTAEQYISDELAKAKASLKQTQVASVILLLIIISYMSYLVVGLKEKFSPKTAATIANGIITERVTTQADELAASLKAKIPQLIQQIPELALKQLPEYRQALEAHVESDFTAFCEANSKDLAKHLDEFLVTHKSDIKELLAHSDNKEGMKVMGPDLEKEIIAFLDDKPESGESIKEKIDQSLVVLDKIAKQTDRLATATDLTPQEKKTRRAIAIIAKKIDEQSK